MSASERTLSGRNPSNAIQIAGALTFTILTAFTLAFNPLRASHDEWWHLKTGQWIAEHGLPENDVFTFTAGKIPWHNHEWLSQLILWRIYEFGELRSWGGIRTVISFKAAYLVMVFGGLGFFLARRTNSAAAGALAATLACGLARRTFYFRPPFITYGFLAFTFCALIAWRQRSRRDWWILGLIPLFTLWCNLHGGFMAGLVILGCFWVESLADVWLAWWRKEPARELKARLGWITLVSGGCFAATFANPYGYHLYELAGRVMNDRGLLEIIYELKPPDWNFVWILDLCLYLLFIAVCRPATARQCVTPLIFAAAMMATTRALPVVVQSARINFFLQTTWRETFAIAAIVAAGARSKERIGLAQTLAALFFAHQGIQHVRHLPLLAVVLAPIIAESLRAWMAELDEVPSWITSTELNPKRSAAVRRACAGLLAAAAGFYIFYPGEAYASLFPKPGRDRWRDLLHAPSMFDRNLALWRGRDMEPGEYPREAVDFLVASGLPGPLFNGGNYAGYLIWRLAPEKYKVFTDNRYDIYGGLFIRDEHIMMDAFEGDADAGIPSWKEVAKKWGFRTLFIPIESQLHRRLSDSDRKERGGEMDWKKVYEDRSFAIWTR
ncbi:hypothetical protein HYR69_05370 [Candidatus Sumerlaeota bacterium]|nr:hypothetical protein [Candidatus Sumerlaeota bacterium]MBI3735333.1 hypothetical protein [Candidatus Sumerlaeota bacterium]